MSCLNVVGSRSTQNTSKRDLYEDVKKPTKEALKVMVDVQHDTPKKRTLTLSSDWYSDFLTGTIDTPTTSHRHRCSSPGIRGRKGLPLSLRRRRGGGECVRAREGMNLCLVRVEHLYSRSYTAC